MALTKIITDGITDDAVTEAKLANAINTAVAANTAKDLTALSASNLTSGTIPDARFPATLPAASAANLTAVPAANITGTLPAISGANLTGISSAGKAHNLIINGAMQVAQRGTSSTTSGYGSVDRFKILFSNTDEAPTHAQVDLTSSDTGPYESGFRKALKITNGNQTSGAGTSDFIKAQQDIEGLNIVNSGWNATDPNSELTISYWVKSSVAQTFFGRFRAFASTEYEYTYSFALSANTWTKITKTVPGNSNFSSIPNTNAKGFFHIWQCFFGTDFTNNKTLDTWAAKDNANKSPDMTSTWYTTNDATFEITGVQLEAGSTATDFEHRSYAQELQLCKRYYEQFVPKLYILARYSHHDGAPYGQYHFNVEKRAAPTCSSSGSFESSTGYSGNPSFSDTLVDSTDIYGANSVTAGGILYLHTSSSGGNGLLKFDAEL